MTQSDPLTSTAALPSEPHPPAEQPDWLRAHQELLRLAARRAKLDWEEGRWLLAAWRERADRQLGYASFTEYIERLFGYSPRTTQEKVRVAEALEKLPKIGQALRAGEVSWSAVRELTRVATPETEQEWLGSARARRVREVERQVAQVSPEQADKFTRVFECLRSMGFRLDFSSGVARPSTQNP